MLVPFSSEVSYINFLVLEQLYFKQERQCTFNVRLRSILTTFVAVEKD